MIFKKTGDDKNIKNYTVSKELSWLQFMILSHDIAPGSDIRPCNKIDLVMLRNDVHYNVA